MTDISPDIRAFLAAAGRKGGKSKSARKQAASRANGSKLANLLAKQQATTPPITPEQNPATETAQKVCNGAVLIVGPRK